MSKYLKIGIYGIWGVFLFLASMEKFGDLFAIGTGIWSVVMLTVAGLCQLLACITAIGWAVLAFRTLKFKFLTYKFVNNYTVPVLIIVLAFVASAARSSSDESRAQKLGFKDGKEFSIARENNITNVADYDKFVDEQNVKKAEKAAQDALAAADKAEQDKMAKYVAIFSDSARKERAQELISKDLKENTELTKKILDEIASYSNDSVERDVAEMDYLDYGVSLKLYDLAIDKSNCRQELKNQLAPYTAWKDSQDWRPFSEFPKSMLKQEMYRRDIVNADYSKKKTELENIFRECVFSLINQTNHLSRPNAKPVIQEAYFPEKLQCVQKNGGDYNACYP
ncbi:hypothetical protein [Enterobacter cloacae]|uniref:hypothetical protein n=1 Tax=Enterobacter cloacae TaxID=550 RepID=UPI001DDD2AAE|nr:hypothetical protein [Escherichia coli]